MSKSVSSQTPNSDDEKRNRTAYNLKGRVTKKLKIISATVGEDMSDIVEELLETYISKYEKENGSITIK